MKHLFIVIPLFSLVLLGQGCLGPTSSGPKGPDLGVYKTIDSGKTWINKRVLVTGPKVTGSVASMSILSMAFDPQDRNTIYLGTAENGVVFTLDGGDSWQQAKTLNAGRVNAIAVDSKNKCTMYATSGNKIFKTETCSRDWKQIFFNPRTEITFTRLALDWYNPTNLFAGTSDGDILLSTDAGEHWQTSHRVDGVPITSLVVDPRDSRILYAGTQSHGIWKTKDSGATWMQNKKQFGDDYQSAWRVTQVLPDPIDAKVVYSVSRYGILKSIDEGETWKALTLTAPPGTVKIHALAIDPKNNKRLIYTGVSTLQFSDDGGITWAAKKLPTTQAGNALLIDPLETSSVYLGTVPAPAK